MREQTKKVEGAVKRLVTAHASGVMTSEELVLALVSAFDYVIGQLEDVVIEMHDAGMEIPNGVELYLVKGEQVEESDV